MDDIEDTCTTDGVNLGYEKCRTVRGMSPRSSCSGAQEEAMMQDGLWC